MVTMETGMKAIVTTNEFGAIALTTNALPAFRDLGGRAPANFRICDVEVNKRVAGALSDNRYYYLMSVVS